MKQQISRIKDVLRTDSGISWAMSYTEQISWILFLKFLDDFETTENDKAFLDWKNYTYILDEKYRWANWINLQKWYINGDDLKDFINNFLFPYLKSFRNSTENFSSIKYKIWEIFFFINNRIEDWNNIREVIDIVNSLSFQKQEDLFELSQVYEDLLKDMWNAWWNNWEFYTPRSIIKIIVDVLEPKIWQTVYDPATGSCGFLIEAFNHMNAQEKNDKELDFLQKHTFFWNEKTPLAYIMWVMNMILHWVSNPNIKKTDTLAQNIKDIQEKDRYDIVLANPPFWWIIKSQVQINFPVKTNATEILFLQHIIKSVKLWWKVWVIVPEWVLFNSWNAFWDIKKWILEDFNLHSIISLPAWVFLPYAWVKTNVIFFDRDGSTKDIWYYEINPWRTLTKNKPITYEEIKEIPKLLKKREIWPNSWIIKVEDIKDFDLSAKNPNKAKEKDLRSPFEIIENIEKNDDDIKILVSELKKIIK